MPSSFSLPAGANEFVGLSGPTKTRVFMVSVAGTSATDVELDQVATIAGPPEQAAAVIEAINHASWTGDRSRLDSVLTSLPEAVRTACNQALERCPAPDTLVLGYDGRPMRVIKSLTFTGDVADLSLHATGAYDVGLQLLIRNNRGERDELEFETALMDHDHEVRPREVANWWPTPPGAVLLERLTPHPDELESVFRDARWHEYVGRAYWLFVRDDDDDGAESWSSTATWFVEFWDVPLTADPPEYMTFVADVIPPAERGPLTPRTRFMLWQSLHNISVDLDGMLADALDDESIVRDDVAPLVGEQSNEWWRQLHQAADRLCEAARTAQLDALVPRTPAEQAIVFLAASDSYVDWARDNLEDPVLSHQNNRLAHLDHDEWWDEVLDVLIGDNLVEEVWENAMGASSPQDVIGRVRSGLYSPDRWHNAFRGSEER